PVLIITRGTESAEKIFTNLQAFRENKASLFSAHTWEKDSILPNLSVNIERMETLTGLYTNNIKIVVAPFLAVLQDLPSPNSFNACTLILKPEEEHEFSDLLRKLVELGYERTDMVEFRGEFSVRGGIIDIFPITSDNPVRVEFFGDEICSIRTFEVHSQRSFKSQDLSNLMIPAARESNINTQNTGLKQSCILDYFKNPALIIWHEFSHIIKEMNRWEKETVIPGKTTATGALFNSFQAISKNFPRIYAHELEIDTPDILSGSTFKIETDALSLKPVHSSGRELDSEKSYQFSLRVLSAQLKDWKQKKYDVTLVCATDAEKKRLDSLLISETDIDDSYYKIETAVLTDGWIIPECRQAVVTDDEIFNRIYTRRRRARKKRAISTKVIENIANINVGEFVVHINHGVGVFEGIKNIKINENYREMIVVRYADDALLYVPLEQAHLIELYVSIGAGKPSLDSLGSRKWSAKRKKAEYAVLDLAAQLLEKQAQRKALEGYSFSRDSEWQLAFEKSFPYPEAPDQLTAITN
ncbi:MAG: hypothetical protein KAR07_10720, partial [Spirochaetes bacterium]|nr:hypothetical protein [Spirochaetota bacterium]